MQFNETNIDKINWYKLHVARNASYRYANIMEKKENSLYNLREFRANDALSKFWYTESPEVYYSDLKDTIYTDIKYQILFGFFQVDIEVIEDKHIFRIASTAHCGQNT